MFVLKEREKLSESVGRTRSGKLSLYQMSDCSRVCKNSVKRRVNGKLLENSNEELSLIGEVGFQDVKSVLEIESEAGKVSSFSSNGGRNRKRNGVSVVLGLAAKPITRYLSKIVDKMECDRVSEDMRTLGEAGLGTHHDGEGEGQDEKKPVWKEQGKSDRPSGIAKKNGESFKSARDTIYEKKRKGYSPLGGSVKRFTRSSIKLMESSTDEPGSAYLNAANVTGVEVFKEIDIAGELVGLFLNIIQFMKYFVCNSFLHSSCIWLCRHINEPQILKL